MGLTNHAHHAAYGRLETCKKCFSSPTEPEFCHSSCSFLRGRERQFCSTLHPASLWLPPGFRVSPPHQVIQAPHRGGATTRCGPWPWEVLCPRKCTAYHKTKRFGCPSPDVNTKFTTDGSDSPPACLDRDNDKSALLKSQLGFAQNLSSVAWTVEFLLLQEHLLGRTLGGNAIPWNPPLLLVGTSSA